MHDSPTRDTTMPKNRGRLAARFGTVAIAACGVLAGGVITAGSAQAAAATATTAAVAPATVTVAATKAVRQLTTATLTASKTSLIKGQRTRLTGVVTIGTGAARKRLAGVKVQIQARSTGEKWHTVAVRTTSKTGVVSTTPRPSKNRYYRLYVPATATRTSSLSKTVTVKVRMTARQKIVAAAVSRIGTPYVFGAAGPNAFDCSGLTKYSYAKAGVSLPHSADAQKRYGKAVSRAAAKPGDLVVFYSGGYAYHAAIYAGSGYIYEAAKPGTNVGKHKIWSSSIGFRRLVA